MAHYSKAQLNGSQRDAVRTLKAMRNAITLIIEEIEIDGLSAEAALAKIEKLQQERNAA